MVIKIERGCCKNAAFPIENKFKKNAVVFAFLLINSQLFFGIFAK